MKVLKSEHNTGRIECGSGLIEDVVMDVHHEVTPTGVLHNEADVLTRLETRKQIHQKGMPHTSGRFEDTLLSHKALHFIPRNDITLFKSFYGKVFASLSVFT